MGEIMKTVIKAAADATSTFKPVSHEEFMRKAEKAYGPTNLFPSQDKASQSILEAE